MIRRLLGLLALWATLAAHPTLAAVTQPLQGLVDSVGAGIPGIAVGDTLSGSVTYDEADQSCRSSGCVVTDITLNLPGGTTLLFADRAGIATVDVSSFPGSLDAAFDIPGAPFGVSGSILLSGIFSSTGPGTFEILGDPDSTTFIAGGTLTVTPLPAALPLLAAALGVLAVVRRRAAASPLAIARLPGR
jgi:hypothetical protein